MIQINSTKDRNLTILSKEYYQQIERSLLLKISKVSADTWFKDFLVNNLYLIITGAPDELSLINKELKKEARKNGATADDVKTNLKEVFQYEWLAGDKKRSYDFAKKLKVNTCPYCNRNFTVTVIKGKKNIVRPDFDHFFPKSKYPLLALSFFNLVPSCPLCNRSIKGSQETVYGKFIHPYEEGYGSTLKFNNIPRDTDSAIGIKDNITLKVLLDTTDPIKAKKCEKNFKLFKLKEIYETSHLNEISDIIRKHYVSGGRYLEVIHKQFPKLGSLEELYKVSFGNYYNEDEFEKRALAKLTKDIVEQLAFTTPTIKRP